MTFLSSIFGRTAPTAEAASSALARVESELAAAPARIAAAEAALTDIAGMSDTDHAAALAERDAARRSAARLTQQVDQLRTALAEAEDAELVASLTARAVAAQKAVDADYVKEIAAFEKLATSLAESAARLDEIDERVASTNRAIEAARRDGKHGLPDPVIDTTRRHRFKAGRIEDDTIVTEQKPCFFENGKWIPVGVTSTRRGEIVLGAGERLMNVPRIVPGREFPSKSLRSPTDDLVIPATRLGGEPLWPRAS